MGVGVTPDILPASFLADCVMLCVLIMRAKSWLHGAYSMVHVIREYLQSIKRRGRLTSFCAYVD